jgi:hypothetical protein
MPILPFALWEPRFQAFCVGLPKTGTTSMARIFKRYRAGHETGFAETVTHVMQYREGLLAPGAFRRCILRRIRENGLEMDSASFNHLYLDLLITEVSAARFILTVREFEPWVNSYLHMLLMWRQRFASRSLIPQWQINYGRFQFGAFDPDDFISLEVLKRRLSVIVDRFFVYWTKTHRQVLDIMDPSRTLILKTDRISESIDVIACFLNIPAASLAQVESHANRRWTPLTFTEFLEPVQLARYRDQIQVGALSKWFPED